MSERLFGFDPDLGYIAAHARPFENGRPLKSWRKRRDGFR